MKPPITRIIRANVWVNPKIALPHDDRQVLGYRKGRSPSQFLVYFDSHFDSQCWRMMGTSEYETMVERWRDLPDDPVIK